MLYEYLDSINCNSCIMPSNEAEDPNPTCSRCGKPMLYVPQGMDEGVIFPGACITIRTNEHMEPEFIDFLIKQLGKYCPEPYLEDQQIMFCYECFLDAMYGSKNKYL